MFYYSALFNQAQLHIERQPTALTPCFIKSKLVYIHITRVLVY